MADFNLAQMSENLKKKKLGQMSPDPVAEAPQIAEAAKTESSMAPETKDLLYQAMIGFIPTLIGAAVGGGQGGAIGAQAGVSGLEKMETQRKEAETKKKEAEKLAMTKEEKAAEKALKEREIAVKERGNVLEEKKLFAETQLKREAAALASKKEGSQKELQSQEFAHKLRQERNSIPTTKSTQEVTTSYSKILGAATDPSPAGDLSLVFGFMKMLDPGSTVREGEFANAQNATGVPGKIANIYNRIMSGDRLNEAQRKDFVNQAHSLYGKQKSVQDKIDAKYAAIAERAGIDPGMILVDYEPEDISKQVAAKAEQKRMVADNVQTAPQKQGVRSLFGMKEAVAAPVKRMTEKDIESMSNEELMRYLGK